MPIVSGLTEFIGYQSVMERNDGSINSWSVSCINSICFLQKYIVEGLTAGAVKTKILQKLSCL